MGEIELEERRAVAENEFYDGDRDQDGDSNDLEDNSRIATKCSSIMSGGDGIRGEKSMSIMNTQHSSKEKSEQSSTPRSLISASDNNRQLPTYQNTSLPTSITTNVTASSASSNNTLNTTVITASNT